MVNKFLLIVGLLFSLTIQAGSAESFCADVIKKHNSNDKKGQEQSDSGFLKYLDKY